MTKIYNHITEDEKIKLARITQDCLDTHVFNPPKTFVNLAVFDKTGLEIERHELLSKSWTRNFYNMLFCLFTDTPTSYLGATFGAGYLACKQTSGTVFSSTTFSLGNSAFIGPLGSTVNGILVGTSDSAETLESYILGSLIANGTGAGQLSYTAQKATIASYDSGTKKMTGTMRRYLNNNSGADITVKEIGLASDYSTAKLLQNRDVLPTPVTVPNGGQLKIDYVMELVYPA